MSTTGASLVTLFFACERKKQHQDENGHSLLAGHSGTMVGTMGTKWFVFLYSSWRITNALMVADNQCKKWRITSLNKKAF
jgi:hypothetical protein